VSTNNKEKYSQQLAISKINIDGVDSLTHLILKYLARNIQGCESLEGNIE
jgi:hypothetical protein